MFSLHFQELLFGNRTFSLPVMMSTSYTLTRVKKKQADPQNPLCFLFTAAAVTVYFSLTGVSWSAPASLGMSVSLHKNSRSHMWSGASGSICMPVVVGKALCRKMISHVLAACGPPGWKRLKASESLSEQQRATCSSSRLRPFPFH